MCHTNKILKKIQAIQKDMTDLILYNFGVITDTIHSTKGKSKVRFLENIRVEEGLDAMGVSFSCYLFSLRCNL